MLAVHITHEAERKYGGIGAVLNGLIPSRGYGRVFDRTLLYGPLFQTGGPAEKRISSQGQILYSGPDSLDQGGWAAKLSPIEARYGVGLVYGRRNLFSSLDPGTRREVDVILVDVRGLASRLADEFKYQLWENFGLDSRSFQDWDYEQYLRLALPYLDLLEALYPGLEAVHLGHEYMGLPTVLKVAVAQRWGLRPGDRTFFYAHEVAPARSIVENLPGHEVSFDNLLGLGLQEGRTLEEDFGPQNHSYRAELVKRVHHLSGVLAVSDNVKDQLLYFQPALDPRKIAVVYNGLNFQPLDQAAKISSRRLIQDYCQTLLNYRPDLIITHMTRLVVSKGLWRDLKLLYRLDALLAEQKLKGFYLLVSTLITSGRPGEDAWRMEAEYGWPVLHRPGWPDLEGEEKNVYDQLNLFNARSRAIKGIFINQFGFSPETCGQRVPAQADRLTLRAASDLELGLSVYEPFGIAQMETYAHGGLPVISRACGCSFLLDKLAPAGTFRVLDFARPGRPVEVDLTDRQALLAMTRAQRNAIEEAVIDQEAPALSSLLEPGQREDLFKTMRQAAPKMGWEAIAQRVTAAIGA